MSFSHRFLSLSLIILVLLFTYVNQNVLLTDFVMTLPVYVTSSVVCVSAH